MATIDLMMLEQRLLRGENPLPILTDLLEHFGPKSFARLGDRASDHPMLAYLICDALRDVFGFEPCMHGAAFVRADDFVRGVFFVEDRFGTVFYFERGSIGVM
nr:hypothetical protein [Planctomycetota bacterium]